jgi:serine protease Do
MRRFVSLAPALVVLVTVLSVLALAPAAMKQLELARMTAGVQFAQARLDASNPIDALNQATRDVAESVLPGVVHIQVRASMRARLAEEDQENADRRERFAPRASAAGWFWSQEGFIVTNAHVVEDAENLKVELYDGRVRDARVIGTDLRTDIAVIKVDDATGINPIRRASGNPVFVGDRVFAFGSPFGIKFSMSQGIVSGMGRSEAASLVNMRSGYTNFIQTDAAMNPGNSGGPLVDARGRVIGMSTAIANNVQYNFDSPSPQGQSAGIGFAIPLETIEAVVTQLLDSSVVIRGYLGITLQEYDAERGRALGLEYDGAGIVVTEVRDDHPASRAGLRINDVITTVNGVIASNPDVLRSIVSIRKPGDTAHLKLWRGGQAMDVDVKIGAAYFTESKSRIDLIYVPGSESMTWDEVRKKVKSDTAPRID